MSEWVAYVRVGNGAALPSCVGALAATRRRLAQLFRGTVMARRGGGVALDWKWLSQSLRVADLSTIKFNIYEFLRNSGNHYHIRFDVA